MVFAIQNSTHAATTITNIEGTISAFSLTPFDSLDITQLVLTGGLSTKFNNDPVSFPTDFTIFNLNRDGTLVISPAPPGPFEGGFIEFSTEGIVSKTITIDGRQTIISLFDATALVPISLVIPGKPCLGNACNTLIIQGTERRFFNPNDEFDFDSLGFFRIDLVGPNLISENPPIGLNFADIIENGGTFISTDFPEASGSFVQSSSDTILVPLLLVPEPGSLSLIVFGLAGLWYVRRHRALPG